MIATVTAKNGLDADQHEFRLTDKGTALITIYHAVPYDLTPYGGPADGQVFDGVIQEIDVATGQLLFEWHSLDHVPLSDSYQPVSTDPSFRGTTPTSTRSTRAGTATCWSRHGTPGRSTTSTARPGTSTGGSAASTATSPSVTACSSPGSTTRWRPART